jgi:hypothetical protein
MPRGLVGSCAKDAIEQLSGLQQGSIFANYRCTGWLTVLISTAVESEATANSAYPGRVKDRRKQDAS